MTDSKITGAPARAHRRAAATSRTEDAPRASAGNLTYLRIMEEVADSGITRAELSRAVGAAERTVQTWAAGTSSPSGLRAKKLLDVQLIVRLLGDTYTREGIQIWLNSRNRNLDMQRPLELLESGRIDEVLEEAERVSES